MTIPTYVSGYPPDGSSLGSTKTTIRGNLDGTFLTLGVDHVNNNGSPGNNPAGYHTIIHQVTQTTIPSTISGVNQFFSMIPGTGASRPLPPNDTQLYSLSGMEFFNKLQEVSVRLLDMYGVVEFFCSGDSRVVLEPVEGLLFLWHSRQIVSMCNSQRRLILVVCTIFGSTKLVALP